jgi:hypothetical protein
VSDISDPLRSNASVLAAMQADTPLSRARAAFSAERARIEQACARRRMPDIYDLRRMEFEAVRRIARALGVET